MSMYTFVLPQHQYELQPNLVGLKYVKPNSFIGSLSQLSLYIWGGGLSSLKVKAAQEGSILIGFLYIISYFLHFKSLFYKEESNHLLHSVTKSIYMGNFQINWRKKS